MQSIVYFTQYVCITKVILEIICVISNHPSAVFEGSMSAHADRQYSYIIVTKLQYHVSMFSYLGFESFSQFQPIGGLFLKAISTLVMIKVCLKHEIYRNTS